MFNSLIPNSQYVLFTIIHTNSIGLAHFIDENINKQQKTCIKANSKEIRRINMNKEQKVIHSPNTLGLLPVG